MKIRRTVSFAQWWPGERNFGKYRFLPIFILAGAGLEYVMINWRVGEVNFYNTYKKRQAKNYVENVLDEYEENLRIIAEHTSK